MKKVLYITYNDYPSGIYSGQVIDVCRFWKEELNAAVSLIAFISLRGFKINKQKILQQFPGAIVLPMFPKAGNWRLNNILLGRTIKRIDPEVIVARGPFATLLAMKFRAGRKLCFDARGAYTAELREYNVVPDEKIKAEIFELEKQAVMNSDFRIAVSEQLVEYWKRSFDYSSQDHVVIPCTLNAKTFADESTNESNAADVKTVTLVYSGGSADWQSFDALDNAMYSLLAKQNNLAVILLAKDLPSGMKIFADFGTRVKSMWLAPEKVKAVLDSCDYGWMVREKSVTNAVASPVKFAEYLSAGLKVIISEELGDYSEFVKQHQAGIIYNGDVKMLEKIPQEEKIRMKILAKNNFMKENYTAQYKKLLQ
ncbi:MAG: hypothetical protein ABIQ40_12300 [Bacteroidia bacterium]